MGYSKPWASAVQTPSPVNVRRILIADDNRDAADTLQLLLSIDGHDVQVAIDGLEALRIAEEFDPDLVVLDIGMPHLTGYEVAARLRDRYPQRQMRLVALSGWGDPDHKVRAQGAGFDQHLTKPIDPEILRDIARTLPLEV